jgi:hypothetical protein
MAKQPTTYEEVTPQAGYTPPATECCGYCKAYSPNGECRWDPPATVLTNADPTMRYVWPRVKPDDWCMRFLKIPGPPIPTQLPVQPPSRR